MIDDSDLPELTDEERTAMDRLGDDFITAILRGERPIKRREEGVSVWTYAACRHCRQRLWLEKFWHYNQSPASGDFSLPAKARILALFFSEHAKPECDIFMFTDEQFMLLSETENYWDVDETDPKMSWMRRTSILNAP